LAGVWLAAEAEFVAAIAIAAAVWFFSNLWQPESSSIKARHNCGG
jgi:hypothetical protein